VQLKITAKKTCMTTVLERVLFKAMTEGGELAVTTDRRSAGAGGRHFL